MAYFDLPEIDRPKVIIHRLSSHTKSDFTEATEKKNSPYLTTQVPMIALAGSVFVPQLGRAKNQWEGNLAGDQQRAPNARATGGEDES
eukprot:COSAG06_NODE_4479_length_4213_cov_1507.910306_2_plen_88_part_00